MIEDLNTYDLPSSAELVPDRTLPLAKAKYPTRELAEQRFAEIQEEYEYILIGTGETATSWAFYVLDKIERCECTFAKPVFDRHPPVCTYCHLEVHR